MNSLTRHSSVTEQPSLVFLDLPPDIIKSFLYLLPIKTLAQMGATCHQFQKLVEDPSYWKPFAERCKVTGLVPVDASTDFFVYIDAVRFSVDQAVEEKPKTLTISIIKKFVTDTQSIQSWQVISGYRSLNLLGFSTLDKAFECAKTILIREEEKNADPGSYDYISSFYDKCEVLVEDYIFIDRNLSKAEEIRQKMVNKYQRQAASFNFFVFYLQENKLEKALLEMKHNDIEHSIYTSALPFVFMAKAKQAKAIDIGLQALKDFQKFKCWSACVKDFHDFLLENGKSEECQQLYTTYPQVFKSSEKGLDSELDPLTADIMCCVFGGQFAKAIQKSRHSTEWNPEKLLDFILSNPFFYVAGKEWLMLFQDLYGTQENRESLASLQQELGSSNLFQ